MRTRYVLAAATWSLVGCTLAYIGIRWTLESNSRHTVAFLVLAIGAGFAKSRLVLRRSGKSIAQRIREQGDGKCLGGFLSWRAWFVVAAMALAGRLLRNSVLPRLLLGCVYTAVGTGLAVTSMDLWRSWFRSR